MRDILLADCMHEVFDDEEVFHFPIDNEWVCIKCFNAYVSSLRPSELAEYLGIKTNKAKEVL